MEATKEARPEAIARQRGVARSGARMVAMAVAPLLLLIALLFAFGRFGGLLTGPSPVPADALGRIDVERLAFRSEGIVVDVVNSGPAELTIAQATVNDALWPYDARPGATIPRLGRATVVIPFPWIEGEPYTVALITANGLTFEKEVALATATPELDTSYLTAFALLGLYAGVVPVYLGLLWWPFLRRLGPGWMTFLISLTTGVLIFLGVDVLFESREIAERVPAPYQGIALLVVGLAVGIGGLVVLNKRVRGAGATEDGPRARLTLAYMIALGIGLHNFGEGLAIGTAYVLGEVALGALLIVGFTVHNATEGVALVGPIARDRRSLWHLVALGAAAGVPTVLGTLVGGLIYSDILATLLLALGAGAIFYVVYQLGRMLLSPSSSASQAGSLSIFFGLVVGLLLMYGTALFIAV